MSANPAETLLKVYGQASLERIARYHGLSGDPLEELTERFNDKKGRKGIVEDLPSPSRELLAFMDKIGRRLRGERLKKRWFLHGYTEFQERIMPLVECGLVVVGNLSAREPVGLDTALEQGILQQWLQVTPGFEKFAGSPPPAREVVEQVADETKVSLSRRLLVVEFNILGAVRFIESNKIRLNRDGSPHRSDLKHLAPFIIDRPGQTAETVPDPNEAQGWDLLVFTLSLAASLGMVTRRDDVLRRDEEGFDYFLKPLDERLPILLRALEQQRAWSELDSATVHASGEPPVTGQGAGGFLEEGGPGAMLAGPRGSVISALRRLAPNDWFTVDETVKTVASLEAQYLAKALPIPPGDEASISTFVESVITLTLTHIGAVEIGLGSKGERRARLTDIGRSVLGIGDTPEEASGKGAILVEPNFEVTCFLDMASLRLLFDLSRFAELTRTSERVVRYRLQGESVQWGYARGYTADGISRILTKFSAQPVPNPVTFALQDWERLHRRVTVLLDGLMVASTGRTDPEVLQSGLTFTVENDDEVEIIDVIHTFVADGHEENLARALNAYKPRIIDYDGPVVPSIYWVDEQRLKAPVGTTDLRTLRRLQQCCELEDDEVYRIVPASVHETFGKDHGFERLAHVLRTGLVGGLSAEREIRLKELLGEPATAQVESMEVLIVGSSEDGDLIDRLSTVKEFIAQRLGPRAFQVIPGTTSKLLAQLAALGIEAQTAG